MRRWLTEYAVAYAIATAALIVTFIGGFAAGVWAGPGASTAAAQSYAHGLQAEWDANTEVKLGAAARACALTTNALQAHVAQMQVEADAAAGAAVARFNVQADAYSERVIGLQEQLRAHGIPERVVSATR